MALSDVIGLPLRIPNAFGINWEVHVSIRGVEAFLYRMKALISNWMTYTHRQYDKVGLLAVTSDGLLDHFACMLQVFGLVWTYSA